MLKNQVRSVLLRPHGLFKPTVMITSLVALVCVSAIIGIAQCGQGCEPTNCEYPQYFDFDRCRCVNPPPPCPIILQIAAGDIPLTDALHGVLFDINADGNNESVSWTQEGSDVAFLVLDRNHNGMIDDGTELFGNFTSQPGSRFKNGFLALAEFDKTENGGNRDGVIDGQDAIFSQLRLWIDSNHNGRSEAGELFELPAFGIRSISLDYRESGKTDEYGNVFRYRAKLTFATDTPNRWAYDVFFTTTDTR